MSTRHRWVVGPLPWEMLLVDEERVVGRVHRTEETPARWNWWVCGPSGEDTEDSVASGRSGSPSVARRSVELLVELHPGCGVRADEP